MLQRHFDVFGTHVVVRRDGPRLTVHTRSGGTLSYPVHVERLGSEEEARRVLAEEPAVVARMLSDVFHEHGDGRREVTPLPPSS